jgi:predicted PurR-regulated permease PerM
MKQVLKYIGYLLVLVVFGYLLWRFYYIITWVLMAAVLSFVGQPLVRLYDRFRIRKLKIPHSLSALLALVTLLLVFMGLLAVFVPLIISQAETISKIDVDKLAQTLESPVQWIDMQFHRLGAIPEGQTFQDFIVTRVKSVVNFRNIGTALSGFINAAGNVFVGFFSVLFIAYFFLKDENMFQDGLKLLVPEKHHDATNKVIADSRNLLKRYFIGIFLELMGVMSLITIGLWILGIKNALLIGFFGGIMNIIPYLGPFIGTLIGISLGVTSTLAFGQFNDLLPETLKLLAVFLTVNFIDNNILVPVIYSKSVKSHPLEIFIVIIMGGGIAGLPGMLLAVPVYTILRVIAREFLQEFRIVRKLTESMDG